MPCRAYTRLSQPPVVMKWTRPLCGPAAMSQNDFKTSETMQPQEASPVKHPMSVLGIDIAKRVFHVVGMDEWGQRLCRKFHIPSNLVVECVTAYRKPPDVRICRLRNQSRVGTFPP